MTNNIPLLHHAKTTRKTIVTVLRVAMNNKKQEKSLLEAMQKVCTFYEKELKETERRIKMAEEELKKSLEEARIKAEQEKRKHYMQKGGGVKIIYLSKQESETIQKIAETLGIEHLEEVGENEDGTEASPSWWGDTAF